MGSPIKGQVKKKNTPSKEKSEFFLTLFFLILDTCSYLIFIPFAHLLFRLVGLRFTDPHQSPIGIWAACIGIKN